MIVGLILDAQYQYQYDGGLVVLVVLQAVVQVVGVFGLWWSAVAFGVAGRVVGGGVLHPGGLVTGASTRSPAPALPCSSVPLFALFRITTS